MTEGRNDLTSARAPEPVGPYPHARRAGDLLFLSGIGPRVKGVAGVPGVTLDARGDVVSYDFESQCRQVFANVRAVLADARASGEGIVDVTVFVTDTRGDSPTRNGLYAEAFAENRPW